jgi:hypothetical protein
MKKEFFPYYISRLILSMAFSILVWGLTLTAALMAVVFFGLFLLYLHSGWFSIDLANPLFPLRRDSHGEAVQKKALILSVVVSLFLYTASIPLFNFTGIPLISGHLALSIGVVAYLVAQFFLFIRT